MATGTRVRINLSQGTLGTAVGTGDTTLDLGADPGWPTLTGDQYLVLVLGAVEIVHVTAYTAAASSCTVERGQEGTAAAAHDVGAAWFHGPTAQDFTSAVTVDDEAGATYTVVADDVGKVKRFTADCTVDLPDGLPVGTVVELMAFGAGGITIQGNGTSTVHNAGSVAQYGTASALMVAADTWVLTGAA